MTNMEILVSIDKFGRLLIPAELRRLLGTNRFILSVERSTIKLKPVPSWDQIFGSMKKIDLKKFEKQHAEDLR